MALINKSEIIKSGLDLLNELGAPHICKVCINNSGSCCHDCLHLLDRVGCQQRNTGCTSWLCGFQKYLLYEVDLLEQWNSFWAQIPGRDYRKDFTPDILTIHQPLPVPNSHKKQLGEALAMDLQIIEKSNATQGYIFSLREKLDRLIDQLALCENDKKKSRLSRNIRVLASEFRSFNQALCQMRGQ